MLMGVLACAVAAQSQGTPAVATGAFATGPSPMLMRHPTSNGTSIVFSFAGDLWSVPKTGGSAIRLTSGVGAELDPHFSPDGKSIAFTGQYDGNTDAFTIPADGGVPKRLTANPSADIVLGWTPDGKSVLLSSQMLSNTDLPQLFTVPASGGFPKQLPLPSGTMGAMNSAGTHIAYVPGFKWQEAWKRYRGGQAYSILIARLSDSKWSKIPRKSENDEQPMWIGNKVYYLSDKRGPVGLYSFDVDSGRVSEEIKGEGFDIKSATAGPDGIVYEKLGGIYAFDPATRRSTPVPIELRGDFPEVRTEFKNLRGYLSSMSISPTGQRAVMVARGNVFTVPASKGDIRQLTTGDGVDRREVSWSPDGRSLGYITDVNGKQELALLDLGSGKERFLPLGDPPAYYYAPTWSPDSKLIAYTDNRHQIWLMDAKDGTSKKLDSGLYTDPTIAITPRWSPDSKWITWSRDLDTHMNAVFVYGVASGKVTQITDGLANAKGPIFDRDGKHLYFYASTNTGQALSWLDLSSFNQPNVSSSVYAVVLKKDGPNPLQPESDEEPIKEEKPTPPAAPPVPVGAAPAATPAPAAPVAKAEPVKEAIDLEGIESRIIALPLPTTSYGFLEPGPAGSFFAYFEAPRATATDFNPGGTLVKFTLSDRKATPFANGIRGLTVSADGNKALLQGQGTFSIIGTAAPTPPGAPGLDLSGFQAKVDPMAEWRRMYHMVWRNERLLFYDPGLHGQNADVLEKRYEPFLAGLRSREDLNYLFNDMLGELSIGHMFIGGGDQPSPSFVPGGLLGCDFDFSDGHYRLTRIYTGERWNPRLRAPLAQPGINAKVGEYVLAIDGQPLTEATDIYEAMEGKAGKQVKIKLGPSADGKGSREVIVVPIASEFALRGRAWGEDNRRRVLEATKGRVGYVHVPDTAQGGWTEFNRYYFAQTGLDGMIVDERFNHGGLINDFMVDEMQKTVDGVFTPRHGKDWPTPGAGIIGPKVMIANEWAGSGGDMFPWLFRHRKIGPIIGKRTWGGLVASFGFGLPDGGSVRAPDCAFYNPHNGTWDVEGYGVAPDIEVELDPFLWRQGKDAQLERAIEEINKLVAKYPYKKLKRPPYPDRSKVDVRY